MSDLAVRENKADVFRQLLETAPAQYRTAARAFFAFLEGGGYSLGDPAGPVLELQLPGGHELSLRFQDTGALNVFA